MDPMAGTPVRQERPSVDILLVEHLIVDGDPVPSTSEIKIKHTNVTDVDARLSIAR